MAFPEANIMNADELARLLECQTQESSVRYCFILGAGASVESGIPTGQKLAKDWMDCMMGEKEDLLSKPMNPNDIRRRAKALYTNNKDGNKKKNTISHEFSKIEKAWKEGENKYLSTYYSDIYTLRFYLQPTAGYEYLEKVMENKSPSIGYRTLALLLTENNQNNLVITTNFDSLTEDALFIYTNKKPLVISHESLVGYINPNIQRPIVAKVHRDLLLGPNNSTETTSELSAPWKVPLKEVFNIYTPIVIGYGGGDEDFMSLLEDKEISFKKQIYWCYLEKDGEPVERILNLLEAKNGYLVKTDGFDSLMLKIGLKKYEDQMNPTYVSDALDQQKKKRFEMYNVKFNDLSGNPETKKEYEEISRAEANAAEQKEELTALDYFRAGDRHYHNKEYDNAIVAYDKAIKLDPNDAAAYNNRGVAYNDLKKYDEAITDFTKAIELDPNDATAYYNRGIAYKDLKKYEEAIADCTKAIELDPYNADAYINRSDVFNKLKEHNEAIVDCNRAIELNPCDAAAYNNRGVALFNLKRYNEAIADCTKAIELAPDEGEPYYIRATAYEALGMIDKAYADYAKAHELDPKYPLPDDLKN